MRTIAVHPLRARRPCVPVLAGFSPVHPVHAGNGALGAIAEKSLIPLPARFPTRETPIAGRRAPRESVKTGGGLRQNPFNPFTGKGY